MYRVLLIEDNPDDAELANRVFEKLGIKDQIQVARDGAEALGLLQQAPEAVQLVLLDLNLPQIGGLEVLRQIRSQKATQQLPVVVLSASHSEPNLLQSFSMGASDYLIKPLNTDRFMEIYRKYVTEPS